MYWISCERVASFRARADAGRQLAVPLIFLVLVLVLAAGFAPPHASAAAEDQDPVLREKLQAALHEPLAFKDRFEAEVWLTDMAGRLSRKVPDPGERLEILTTVHREAARVGQIEQRLRHRADVALVRRVECRTVLEVQVPHLPGEKKAGGRD